MSDYQTFEAVVRDVEQITPSCEAFYAGVARPCAPLPVFSGGGSHINRPDVQDGEQRYSNALFAYELAAGYTTSWQDCGAS